MSAPRINPRDIALRALASALCAIAVGYLRYGGTILEPHSWTFQMTIYGVVFGIILALWKVGGDVALAFGLVYYFVESAFFTGALMHGRWFLAAVYLGLPVAAIGMHHRLFLTKRERRFLLEIIGLGVLMGIAFLISSAAIGLWTWIRDGNALMFGPLLRGPGSMGFLLGCALAAGYALIDHPRIHEILKRR